MLGGVLSIVWVAPVQAVVTTITSEADAYAAEVHARLTGCGLRSELDVRNEKISYKVREHSLRKVPVIVALGKREVERREVSVRRLGSKAQVTRTLDEFVDELLAESQRLGEVPLEASAA